MERGQPKVEQKHAGIIRAVIYVTNVETFYPLESCEKGGMLNEAAAPKAQVMYIAIRLCVENIILRCTRRILGKEQPLNLLAQTALQQMTREVLLSTFLSSFSYRISDHKSGFLL